MEPDRPPTGRMSGPSAGRAVPGWALQAGTGEGRGEGVPRHKPATCLSEEGASQVMVTGQTGRTRPASHLGQLGASSPPRGGLCGKGHDKNPRDYMAASAVFFQRPCSRCQRHGPPSTRPQGLGSSSS